MKDKLLQLASQMQIKALIEPQNATGDIHA